MDTTLSTVLENKGRDVHCIDDAATVMEAVRVMNRLRIGAILVRREGRPVGILTERDVLTRVVAAGLDSGFTSVVHVMTRDLLIMPPETTVGEALGAMTQQRCRHVPVMDGDVLCGLVSQGDLVAAITTALRHELQDLTSYIAGPASVPPGRVDVA